MESRLSSQFSNELHFLNPREPKAETESCNKQRRNGTDLHINRQGNLPRSSVLTEVFLLLIVLLVNVDLYEIVFAFGYALS